MPDRVTKAMQSKNSPLDVTVVIPTYNREGLITRALESVRTQHRPPERVIVVDDASRDDTTDVVWRWASETGFPVTIEMMRQNGGPAKARNRGIELAKTKYVAFLDSDDEYIPDTLWRLVTPLEFMPEAVVSFADTTLITPTGTIPHGFLKSRIHQNAVSEKLPIDGLNAYLLRDATDTFLRASFIPTCSSCFRRSSAITAGLMPEVFRSGEDWLFWLRLSKQGLFIFQFEDLSHVYRHDANLTHGDASKLIVREKLLGFMALIKNELNIPLSPAQLARTRRYYEEYEKNWRYHLSKLGLRHYILGIISADGEKTGGPAHHLLDIKSLLRSIFYSVKS